MRARRAPEASGGARPERWSGRSAPGAPEGLILFDGVCVLCSRWVRFVMEHDRERRFRFLPVQSDTGRLHADRLGLTEGAPETIVVVLGGRAWFKSDAALAILGQLPATRRLAGLRRIPRPLRDAAYDLIARHRYRLFGRSKTCMVPTLAQRERFLG